VASDARSVPLALVARVGGATRAVDILETEPHHFRVTIDGVAHVVDNRIVRPGWLSLLIDHRSYSVEVRADGDRHRVDIAGRTIEVTLLDALRHSALAASKEDANGPREIRAMMPGKIVTVLVNVGDTVEKDQGLLVVEAMKMENELRAPGPGVVREVRVNSGQAVEAGELLARIE